MSIRAAWSGSNVLPKFGYASSTSNGALITEYAVEGLFPRRCSALLYGPWEAYKSTIIADIAVATAKTGNFHGYKTQKGLAVIVLGEDLFGMRRRIVSRCTASKIKLRKDPLLLTRSGIDLLKRENAKMLREKLKRYMDAFKSEALFVGIDTLVRNFGDGNENDAADMSHFFENIERYIRDPFGALVMVAHHPGHKKSLQPRGSSALLPGVDLSVLMKKNRDGVTLSVPRSKQGIKVEPLTFQQKLIELPWKASNGKPDMGMVLELVGAGKAAQVLNDAPQAAKAFFLLKRMCENKHQKNTGAWASLQDVPFAISAWQKKVIAEGICTGRKGFHRRKQLLVKRKLIVVCNGQVRVR